VPHRLRRLRHARRKLDDLGPVWLLRSRAGIRRARGCLAWQLAGPGPLWWRHLVDQVIATAHRELRIDYLRERAGSEGIVGDPPLYDVDLIEYTLRLPRSGLRLRIHPAARQGGNARVASGTSAAADP